MTHGKRRDIRTAIRTKREEPFNLWAFIVALQVPPLSALTPTSVRRSFSNPVPSLSNPSSPTPLLLTLFPSLFEPCPTVYKVVLLNWKPQLCRSYQLSHPLLPHFSSPFFPPHWAVPFSSSLLFTILLPLALLTSVVQDARGTDRLSFSWHWGWLDLLGWPRFAKFSLSSSGRSCTWPDLGIWSSGGKFVCPDTASITAFLVPRPVHGDNRRLRFPAGSAVF